MAWEMQRQRRSNMALQHQTAQLQTTAFVTPVSREVIRVPSVRSSESQLPHQSVQNHCSQSGHHFCDNSVCSGLLRLPCRFEGSNLVLLVLVRGSTYPEPITAKYLAEPNSSIPDSAKQDIYTCNILTRLKVEAQDANTTMSHFSR